MTNTIIVRGDRRMPSASLTDCACQRLINPYFNVLEDHSSQQPALNFAATGPSGQSDLINTIRNPVYACNH